MAEKISASDLKAQKDDFVIMDVREADELAGGKIEGSIHMPLGLTIRNANKKQIEDLEEKKFVPTVEQVIEEILLLMSCPKKDSIQLP